MIEKNVELSHKLSTLRDSILASAPAVYSDVKDGFFAFSGVFSPLVEIACTLLKSYHHAHGQLLSYREFQKVFLQVLASKKPGATLAEIYQLSSLDVARIDDLVQSMGPIWSEVFSDIVLTETELETMSNDDFLTFVYQHLLGRAPDPDGFSDWIRQLEHGQSRAAILLALDTCEERRELNLPQTIRIASNNETPENFIIARLRRLQELEIQRHYDLAQLICAVERAS